MRIRCGRVNGNVGVFFFKIRNQFGQPATHGYIGKTNIKPTGFALAGSRSPLDCGFHVANDLNATSQKFCAGCRQLHATVVSAK